MSIAAWAVKKKTVTYFATFLLAAGGLAAYFSLGQLEDPEYTVKTANIITEYPGASPEEVELEVTDRIELKIQELKELKWVESYSRAGLSYVKVEILPTFWSDKLPQVWDHLRKKIREVEGQLPPGAKRPQISDDFGDVYGFQLALVGDGFDPRQLEKAAKELKREISLVTGVARVDLWGVQEKLVYLDIRETQLSELGLSDQSIADTLEQQNLVVDAGKVDLETNRYRIAPTGQFRSPRDIADLVIRPSTLDTAQAQRSPNRAWESGQLIRIGDIGSIRRGYREPPANIMNFSYMAASGEAITQAAIGISITNRPGVNIVDVGTAIDARLEEIKPLFPIGIEWHKVHWQSDIVAESIEAFLINFAEAVGIVLIVLTLAMGWRMGVIIGSALIVTVLGTFLVMAIMDIDLHRISLGALVIALGMMVDNAIVVAEGMMVRLQQGMDRVKAAVESATQPAWPLLGATVIAVVAFYPIAGSPESTGEYCFSLAVVVGISLLVSWIISLTFTPVLCIDMVKAPKAGAEGEDPYRVGFYGKFRALLEGAIRFRVFTLAGAVGFLVISVVAFGGVRQEFFPPSSMPKFMIDYYAPDGTRIEDVAARLRIAEEKLRKDERVSNVTAYIGSGPPRFYLPVEPEEPNQAYGQLIINVHDFKDIDGLIEELEPWAKQTYPGALVPVRKYGLGPGKTWKFEIRVIGPAVADAAELRAQAEKFEQILLESPYTGIARTDWMNLTQMVVPEYNSERGRLAAVTRDDIAGTTKRAYDGREIGLYREGDDLIPIVLRHVGDERANVGNISFLQVKPALQTATLPLAQVIDGVGTEWENPIIRRRDRRRTIKVQANAVYGQTMPTLLANVEDKLPTVELPPGYKWEWSGEIEETIDSQAALIPGIVPALVIMILILVNQFNAFRPMIIMVATIPFVIIGVSAALLALDIPFGFMTLLGVMALGGMMIKNGIVLLDQVEIELEAGKSRYDAIVDSAVMRLRPVLLAAGTTVLGVIPLLQDGFWQSMAVAIMGGLTVGTILTMILLPALYAIFYRLPSPKPQPA